MNNFLEKPEVGASRRHGEKTISGAMSQSRFTISYQKNGSLHDRIYLSISLANNHVFPHATGTSSGQLLTWLRNSPVLASQFCPYIRPKELDYFGEDPESTRKSIHTRRENIFQVSHKWLRFALIRSAIGPKGPVPAVEYHSKALYKTLVMIHCELIQDAYPTTS
ncbi:hypothetical protein B0H17DRAFT_715697 [Mycena rosella]|uniref:Uncharacterized protein n=1 Tax=Mycena rosella TaxID=1033263 RepID=A0AAD7DBG7_MYCRO|nr:hypothetical protein B0H17DRAFT_715697 [Mycena rosella]